MTTWRFWTMIGVLLWAAGCTPAETPPPTLIVPLALPTTAVTPSLPPPTPTPPPDSGWQLQRPGMELRTIRLVDENGRLRDSLTLLRLDPALYEFRVAYHPGAPQTVSAWQAETGALLVVNGGFFTPEWYATGLVIIEGAAFGSSYEGFGGMVAITETGIELWSLAERPYSPSAPLTYALQSFPLLVQPGARGYPNDDGQPARRTVMAQDRDGRILFIVASFGSFTLYQLSQYLLASDLNLEIALNLDGGASTGLYLADPPLDIPAFTALPTVITVFPR